MENAMSVCSSSRCAKFLGLLLVSSLAGRPSLGAPQPASTAAPAAAAPTAGSPTAGATTAGTGASSTAPALPAAPARPAIPEVVAKIQKVYENTANLKVRFAQTLVGPMGKRQASGILYIKKPGKMRWDYEKPEKKLFVADGTTLWMYEPEDEQAFRQPLSSSQLPAQVSFLFGRGKLLDEFDVSYFDGAGEKTKPGETGDLVLKLVPKKPTAQYKFLVFIVSSHNFLVKETLLYDQQGGTNELDFSGLETNLKTGVDDSRFSFTPPPGTKIINPNH
jgi:outer membrane lipoprotein carrier protein